MIIQTGMRTDIPAFYSRWFANRLLDGYVLVRNPYNPISITRYELNPEVVDMIGFCTKNPEPMFPFMHLLKPYGQYWFVTITPYGKEIEPHVPPKEQVIASFIRLSKAVGIPSIGWRYDPIMIDNTWTVEKHIETFTDMCRKLSGYTDTCIISFLDLYQKIRINYPEAKAVAWEDQVRLTKTFVNIAMRYGITIKPCGENSSLAEAGADCSGCMTVKTFERAIGKNLSAPPNPNNRVECACYLTGDIGQYDTCGHLCRYCYANANPNTVRENMKHHDPKSPLLVGQLQKDDVIHQAKQISWIDPQMRFDFAGGSK